MTSLRVLVVEDDAAQVHMLRSMLQTAGHVVTATFGRGDDPGLPAAVADVDVAVIDLTLPGVSGIELIRRLLDQRPELPVLVLSSSSHSAAITEALLAGALGYIVKGARMQELLDAVALVSKRKPALSSQAQAVLKLEEARGKPGDVDAAVARVKRFL
jgi:DNA-binding NarL/FixJ family response regulator